MLLFNKLEDKIDLLLKRMNGKTIILWGYGYSGRFFEFILGRSCKRIDYYLDNNIDFPSKYEVYTTSILGELDPKKCFLVVAFKEDDNSKDILAKNGFDDTNSINLIKEIYGDDDRKLSYYDWLEYEYSCDLVGCKRNESLDRNFYSYGNDYSVIKVLDEFNLGPNDGFFDFGCGKGGTLILASEYGCRIGGVEYDKELYGIALDNLMRVGVEDYDVLCNSAEDLTVEIDNYNYFFMYNPFVGETFQKVIENIENSYDRNPREIILLYSGVTCHNDVVKNGRFVHTKRIASEYWNKYTNIYMIT